jgi:energy-coupling factor transport system substrate-specific component
MTWQVSSYAVLAVVIAVGFGWYERRKPPARVVGLVAVLAALAVVGRLAFAAIPNVKPTTDIVLFAGYALGGVPGFAVGAMGAVASNVFLGQGPWTAWQMAAWGGVGIGGALLARVARGRELSRVELAVACGVAGLAFGAFMDVYQWSFAARQDLATYLAIAGTSLPYNLAHAIGNVVFCLLIGPVFVRSLRRYRRRFEVSWPAPSRQGAMAGAAGVVAALALLVTLTAPAPAIAASPAARATD